MSDLRLFDDLTDPGRRRLPPGMSGHRIHHRFWIDVAGELELLDAFTETLHRRIDAYDGIEEVEIATEPWVDDGGPPRDVITVTATVVAPSYAQAVGALRRACVAASEPTPDQDGSR